ncbi:Zn-dependent protease (includes SpoIVFB) [Chitinophaga sp. YR627]|uniref:site-2 protease family protein n=1 Tax=Chitinophaga sp. YR627 TaxID=1881041 RepID=UPI0008EF8C3F|nr:site-2 protease family protein [Chitinophaga sp. YR627]SFM71332.1 Zn-dependent protease (includes SpoIVFB) [Chitinophaga sp. YR627]
MKHTFTLMTIKGTRVGIHWSFLLLIGWLLIIEGQSGKSAMHTFWSLLVVMGILATVIVHELAHMYTASYFGIKTRDILLSPIGGFTHLRSLPDTPGREIMISLSGPLANLLIGIILIPLLPEQAPVWKSVPFFLNTDRANFLFLMHAVNILVAIVNLIPVFPMDGGRILRAVLEVFTTPVKATNITIWTGRFISLLVLATGILNVNILLIVAGLYLLLQGAVEKEHAVIRMRLSGLLLKDLMTTRYHSIPGNMSLRDALEALADYRQPYFIITDGKHPIGVLDRGKMLHSIDRRHIGRPVTELLDKQCQAFDAGIPAIVAWEQLPPEFDMIVPITVNGNIAGVISRDTIVEYLILHDQEDALGQVYS